MKSELPASQKRWIRPLPERLVNKIAAGEVIERPAAVLKELVENSLDAGATRIDIVIEKSGTRLISVLDNGCGIAAEQVEVAFSRHATSKISDFSDLEKLRTFGFRGEALPSIGSVSRTKMVTRSPEAELGMEIVIEGGVKQSLKPIAIPVGTKVEVEDLFFNTPARRKFLKAETTEARHLSRNAVAMALSAPEVRFSYALNGRTLFALGDGETNLRVRVGRLLFEGDGADLQEIASETEEMKVAGLLSPTNKCRQNQYGLYIYINDRYIKSQSLVHAITSGYGELLPRGNYPAGAVFLTIDPAKVDVNVHPTKAEVRLSNEQVVHDILHQAVKRSLRESGVEKVPGVTSAGEKPADRLTVKDAIRMAVSVNPDQDVEDAVQEKLSLTSRNDAVAEQSLFRVSKEEPIDQQDEKSEAERYIETETPVFMGQFAGLYLIFKTEKGLVILDQHAAHERVLYEENLKAIETGGAVSQNLLFPVNIELAADRYALYEDSAEILRATGFVVEPFGSKTVLLSAVPSTLSRKSPERMFLQIVDDIEVVKRAGYDLKKAVAQSVACRSAVMAGDRFTSEEATALYKRLMATENHHCCPHGRPTTLKISKNELDGKFGRK